MRVKVNYPNSWFPLFKTSLRERCQSYNSIDTLPIAIWFKVSETKDLKHLIISGKPKDAHLAKCWFDIMSEYIELFGLNEDYKELIEARQNLILSEIQYALTKDRTELNFIQMYKVDVKIIEDRMNMSSSKSDSFKLIASVEKYLGFKINEQSLSTRKFYNYIEISKDEYKKHRLEQIRRKNGKG